MNHFHEMDLPPELLQSLDRNKFTTPTPIQAQTIPLALSGKDILGSAQTGTGKTLAFGIPLIAKLLNSPHSSALILTPTRELAIQVVNAIKQLLSYESNIKTALLIGGEQIFKQFSQLKLNPRIVVGTPGRIIDHLERKTFRCDKIDFLVLDETDRMFDMGFGEQLEDIMSKLQKQRQSLMFSATIPAYIEKLAAKYFFSKPERISVGHSSAPIAMIKQEVIKLSEGEKYDALLAQLNQREGSVVIFVKTKSGADYLADRLSDDDHDASAIHGDLRQHKRERVLNDFRRGKNRIMVATDVAARGLDVPHIQHVFNYDIAQVPEDHVHRIGRTGRNGAEGNALSFVTPSDERKWRDIQKYINPGEKFADDLPPEQRRSSQGRRRPFGGNVSYKTPRFGGGGFGSNNNSGFGNNSTGGAGRVNNNRKPNSAPKPYRKRSYAE